jgi:NAD(P)-dependent dehydrogenase (short-subunit alcohol dehydrogenase family)
MTSYLARQRLDGRVALVTGGARGIGLCTAEALAEAGARVVITDMNEAELGAGRETLAGRGYTVETAMLDVTDAAATTELADRLNRDLGAVDVLIANAGIAWKDTPAEDVDDQSWAKVLDVNINGVFWGCRAFGRHMLERRRGSIVAVGSMSGFISNWPQGQVHYNTSKAAVHHMVRSLAGEWAERGVRVNAVAPTYVKTAMTLETAKNPHYLDAWVGGTPMNRMIDPEEVASAMLFLASDAASGMTGSIVLVDAGYTIW